MEKKKIFLTEKIPNNRIDNPSQEVERLFSLRDQFLKNRLWKRKIVTTAEKPVHQLNQVEVISSDMLICVL